MHDEYVLGADVGGTNLRIAAVAADGTILHEVSSPTPKTAPAQGVIDEIVSAAQKCVEELADSPRPKSFGLALAALVNPTVGRILRAPNLPQLDDLQLVDIVSDALGLDVVIENDATAAAIGEHWLGSSRATRNSVFVTLGTGVGGGLILEGRPYRGEDGTAGEIGHICVEPDGVPCGCGSHGCVEQYASATAIVRIAKELAGSDPTSSLAGKSELTSLAIYEAGVAGDRVAQQTFATMGRYLGIALAGLVDVLNPGLIVIGGGPAGAWDLFIEHVRTEINERAFQHPSKSVRLVRASLGGSAGILGAARLAFDSLQPRAQAESSLY